MVNHILNLRYCIRWMPCDSIYCNHNEGQTTFGNKRQGQEPGKKAVRNTKTSNFQASSKQETNVFDQTAAREHWYDLWYPNLDGTHSAECKRSGCNDVRTAECTLLEITMMDGEGEVILTVCPVCGDHEETPFAAILDADIKAVDKKALPRGEMIVRGMEAPFDGVLYAFTAAYEATGKLESFKGTVSVILPLDAEKYTEFRLVRMDVPPATESTGCTEVWMDAAFAYEDGNLTFETDMAGLFLLIPKQ